VAGRGGERRQVGLRARSGQHLPGVRADGRRDGRVTGEAVRRYDPELLRTISALPTVDFTDVADTRRTRLLAARRRLTSERQGVTVRDVVVDGPPGGSGVPVRVYRPSAEARELPAVCYIHGGGWVFGSIDEVDARGTQLCREIGAVMVSVGYRLAPEHPYPAALDDCVAVLEWIAANAADLGIDVDRVAVHRTSAGAGLAAGLPLVSRDRSGPPICFQSLVAPLLDDRLRTWSMREFVDTAGVDREFIRRCWELYLGDDVGEVSQYAAPARATELSGL